MLMPEAAQHHAQSPANSDASTLMQHLRLPATMTAKRLHMGPFSFTAWSMQR